MPVWWSVKVRVNLLIIINAFFRHYTRHSSCLRSTPARATTPSSTTSTTDSQPQAFPSRSPITSDLPRMATSCGRPLPIRWAPTASATSHRPIVTWRHALFRTGPTLSSLIARVLLVRAAWPIGCRIRALAMRRVGIFWWVRKAWLCKLGSDTANSGIGNGSTE